VLVLFDSSCQSRLWQARQDAGKEKSRYRRVTSHLLIYFLHVSATANAPRELCLIHRLAPAVLSL
jgi:hypothetical protein